MTEAAGSEPQGWTLHVSLVLPVTRTTSADGEEGAVPEGFTDGPWKAPAPPGPADKPGRDADRNKRVADYFTPSLGDLMLRDRCSHQPAPVTTGKARQGSHFAHDGSLDVR